jgi:hypothetical protein
MSVGSGTVAATATVPQNKIMSLVVSAEIGAGVGLIYFEAND